MQLANSDHRKFNLLVVDDDITQLRLLEYLLKELELKHRCHYASDGKKALDFLHRRPPYEDAPRPDIILLDQNMPGMTGREVLHAIKTDRALSMIPVLVLSQSLAADDINACYSERANAYIGKPVDFEANRKLVSEIDRFWMRIAKLPEAL